MDYEKLKEVIAKKIKENGRGKITGPILQAVLMAMVDSLGEVYPQTYTDEQKAQARANIDALSNYDGEITKEKLSAEVQAILDDVANKQNITDETLATIAKTIVGAINELFNGGIKDSSVVGTKLADNAVTTDKLADYSVTMAKISKPMSTAQADLALSVYHSLIITMGELGNITFCSNGINLYAWDEVIAKLFVILSQTGNGITFTLVGEGGSYTWRGTVVGVTYKASTISAIVKDEGSQKDYFVTINNKFAFATKICLTDQLPKIASLETDVTTLQGLINTKVKIINEDTDLNTLTEDGLYLLSAGHTYTNYPSSDAASGDVSYPNNATLLIVSYGHTETTISQVLISVSNSHYFPMIRCRNNYGNGWAVWNDDRIYPLWQDVNNSVKYADLSALTDTEINNIWDNN